MLAAICTYSLLGVTNQALADTTQTKQIPLHFIVAATDKDGANAKVDQATIEQSIENLNSHYQGTGYSYHYKSTDFVTNEEMPGFYDDDYSPDNRVLFIEPYFDKSALNVMVADFDGVNGNAFFPYFGVDGVLIDTEDLVTTTLAHEIGHNLSLLHTFADGDDEPISVQIGERGYLYGDQIIDTPPSFDDLDDDIENCEYTGSAEDEEGTPYAPDAKNIMSQGKNTCRTHFSAQQIDRMQYVLQRDKYHLFNQFGEGRTVPNCENSIIVTQFPHIDGFNFNQEIAQPWVQDVANNGFFFRTSPDSNSSRTG
ncbi:M43 family zinc metalloprotease, partial [uncultured Pseudoalteromonas sp.]